MATEYKNAAQMYANRYPTSPQQNNQIDYKSILNDVYTKLNQPRQTFTFNADQDAGLQSAMNAARQAARNTQANTTARLRAGGQGRSSYSEQVAHQIGQQAEQDIAQNIRPQYEQMAYERFLNNQNAERQNMLDALTIGQEYNRLGQQDINNARADAELTGTYLPPAVQNIINEVLGLKRQAESGGVSSEQMGQFRSQADALRGQLQSQYGIDPNQLGIGYENDYQDALRNAGNYRGMQTLASQRHQLDREQMDLNQMQVMAQLTGMLPDGTPTSSQQQLQLNNLWQVADATGAIPDELAEMYGLPRGTPTQAAKQFAMNMSLQERQLANQISNQNANNSLARERFEFDKAQAAQRQNQQPEMNTNEIQAEVISFLDNMTDEQRANFFSGERANLIRDLGLNGYNQLYRLFFDEYGYPIQRR